MSVATLPKKLTPTRTSKPHFEMLLEKLHSYRDKGLECIFHRVRICVELANDLQFQEHLQVRTAHDAGLYLEQKELGDIPYSFVILQKVMEIFPLLVEWQQTSLADMASEVIAETKRKERKAAAEDDEGRDGTIEIRRHKRATLQQVEELKHQIERLTCENASLTERLKEYQTLVEDLRRDKSKLMESLGK